MKKIKILIYILLFNINITMQFMNSLDSVVLFSKHFSLFLILALASYDVVTKLTKKLITYYKLKGTMETIVYIGRVITFAILIILISRMQISYVKFQDVPYIRGCKYYDQYNHLIYQSEYALSCPELNIEHQDSNLLIFNVTETKTFKDSDKVQIGENQYIDNHPILNIKRLSTIAIEYGKDNRIDKVSYQISTLYLVTAEGYDNWQSYYSSHQVIKNEYGANSFDQIVLKASRTFDSVPIEIQSNLKHHTFEEGDFLETHFYTVEDSRTSSNITYRLVKDYKEEGEAKSENIASINYSLIDDKDHYSIKINEKKDYAIKKVVDITLSDQDVLYSILEDYPTGSYQTIDIMYKQYSGYNNIISSYKMDYYNEDVITYYLKKQYSFVSNIDGHDYLVMKSRRKENSVELNKNNNEMIYLIEPTEYGNKVIYKSFREQSYINYLIYGEYKMNFNQFEPNFNSNLFNIEYQIEKTSQSSLQFYSDMPFLIFHD